MEEEIINLDILQQMVYPNVICVVPLKEGGKQLKWSTNGRINKRTFTVKGEYFVLSAVYKEVPVIELDPHYFGCSGITEDTKQIFAQTLERILNGGLNRYIFYDQPDLTIHVNMEMVSRICENFIDVTVQGTSIMGHQFPQPTWAILLTGDCSVIEKLGF